MNRGNAKDALKDHDGAIKDHTEAIGIDQNYALASGTVGLPTRGLEIEHEPTLTLSVHASLTQRSGGRVLKATPFTTSKIRSSRAGYRRGMNAVTIRSKAPNTSRPQGR